MPDIRMHDEQYAFANAQRNVDEPLQTQRNIRETVEDLLDQSVSIQRALDEFELRLNPVLEPMVHTGALGQDIPTPAPIQPQQENVKVGLDKVKVRMTYAIQRLERLMMRLQV